MIVDNSRVYDKDSKEYHNLEKAAILYSKIMGEDAWIDTTWLDFGAKMAWTTVVAIDNSKYRYQYQVLSPNIHIKIVNASSDLELVDIVKEYCLEKLSKRGNGSRFAS